MIRELRVNDVVRALLRAYEIGDRNYLEEALNLIHEETTFIVSDNEEPIDDALKRISTLHALYSICLGMIKKLSGEEAVNDYIESISKAVNENDLSSLTRALISLTMKTLNNDYTWIDNVNNAIKDRQTTLNVSIIREFLGIINLIRTPSP